MIFDSGLRMRNCVTAGAALNDTRFPAHGAVFGTVFAGFSNFLAPASTMSSLPDFDLGATLRGHAPGQKVFGRYTLKKILGRGGMGIVWLARDEELEREVALKFLPEIVALDRESVTELKRETRRNLELTHPHIVRIHDFVQDGQSAAISMEYVDGATLSALKAEQPEGVFGIEQIRPWVKQLGEGLAYAHERAQIVHRDLKPANLMINQRGELKITDFGVATSIADSVSRVSKQAGSSGTPFYMSPQQMMGEKPAATDDIYSIGATLYELLTGKPPFYTGNVIAQVTGKVPPTIAARREELGVKGTEPVPQGWEETIAACLAKEPGQRPRSVQDVLSRLAAGTGTEPTRASGPAAAIASQTNNATSGPASSADAAASRGRAKSGLLLPAFLAAVAVIASVGYYFGLHLPTKEKEARQLAAEQRRLAARGAIIVRTVPAGAEVIVGSLEHGVSPLTVKEVRLGRYPVKARHAGYDDWEGEVEVKENEFAEVTANLVRSTGTIRDPSERPAEWYRAAPIDDLEDAAEAGDLEAMIRMGDRFACGMERWDPAEGRKWYERAAAAGYTPALIRMGNLHLSLEEDLKWYKQGADSGEPMAVVNWGHLVREGRAGNAAEPVEQAAMRTAFEEIKHMAEAGDWYAMLELAYCYDVALGTERDGVENVRWTRAAAEQGDARAMGELARFLAAGRDVPRDEAEAFRWYLKAAQKGHHGAQHMAGIALFRGQGVAVDKEQAVALFRQSAEGGDAPGMQSFAAMHARGEGGLHQDDQIALHWSLKAAELGNSTAQLSAGIAYYQGRGTSENKTEAVKFFRQSAEAGNAGAMDWLGSMYAFGEGGLPKDEEQAIGWWQKGARLGSVGCQEELKARNLTW